MTTLIDVAHGPVRNHDTKEDGVEPGERAIEARNQAPGQCEEHIAAVVNLAR